LFNNIDAFKYKYAPILSLSPAEMKAIEELPEKDKDIILPIIPIKGWVGSQKIENSIPRIIKAIGDRFWIADIDESFLTNNKNHQLTGKYPRQVFYDVEKLLESTNGYDNWYQYLKNYPKAIPTIQISDFDEIKGQVSKLRSLDRGLAIKLSMVDIESNYASEVFQLLEKLDINDLFVIFDYGEMSRERLAFAPRIISVVENTNLKLPAAMIAIPCSSFPSSFSNQHRGEYSIYERQLFNIVSSSCSDIRMIYSDKGGARAEKINGGGGIPAPRIDYPLKNDWRFIRKEFNDSKNPQNGEKERLYTQIAQQIIASDYWLPDLHVWGTQAIEFTSKGDRNGINSPAKATAVRLNIHLYQQLHYDTLIEMLDTDEDWQD
jgi:hypothetical protein